MRDVFTIDESMGAVISHMCVAYSQLTVVRRYNDFLWLHEQLTYHFPGAIVAPLPEKNVVRRFSQEFIEASRWRSASYLRCDIRVIAVSAACTGALLESDCKPCGACYLHALSGVLASR
jgi:hypothetical protein